MRITEFLGIYNLVDLFIACCFAAWICFLVFMLAQIKGILIYREGNSNTNTWKDKD